MNTEASVSREAAASRRRPAMALTRPGPPQPGSAGRPPDRSVRVSEAQRIRLLLALAAPVEPCRCLLLTQRGESRVLRDALFEAGGDWTTAHFDGDTAGPCVLPYPDGVFDRVVVLDVRAAVADPSGLDREVARVLAPGGAAIITEPKYRTGSARGCSWEDLHMAMLAVDLRPVARASHSGFFTMLADAASEVGAVRTPQGAASGKGRSGLPRVRGPLALLAVRACTFLDRVFRGRGGAPVIVALKNP
jgi:SAM-dependent methyltransferase